MSREQRAKVHGTKLNAQNLKTVLIVIRRGGFCVYNSSILVFTLFISLTN